MNASSLKVGLSGRLGNNILQLINSIIYCHIYKIKEIIFDSQGWHRCGDNLAAFLVSPLSLPSGIQIQTQISQSSSFGSDEYQIMLDDHVLENDIFHYLSDYNNLCLARNDVVSFLSRVFAQVQHLNDLEDIQIPSGSYIAIHLRGDDVFGRGVANHYGIPSGYVQPPFCFYKKVLNHIIQSKPQVRVVLLAQDDLNPVLQVLSDYLMGMDVLLDVEFASLPRTIMLLRHATEVISSRGTFVVANLAGARKYPNVYYFRDEECKYLGSLMSCFMKRHIVKDSLSKYTRQGDWMCLPHQIKMMLNYPGWALDPPQCLDGNIGL